MLLYGHFCKTIVAIVLIALVSISMQSCSNDILFESDTQENLTTRSFYEDPKFDEIFDTSTLNPYQYVEFITILDKVNFNTTDGKKLFSVLRMIHNCNNLIKIVIDESITKGALAIYRPSQNLIAFQSFDAIIDYVVIEEIAHAAQNVLYQRMDESISNFEYEAKVVTDIILYELGNMKLLGAPDYFNNNNNDVDINKEYRVVIEYQLIDVNYFFLLLREWNDPNYTQYAKPNYALYPYLLDYILK